MRTYFRIFLPDFTGWEILNSFISFNKHHLLHLEFKRTH